VDYLRLLPEKFR
jgi:hypothetical protein